MEYIIGLLVLGFLLVIVEIFLLPGITVAGFFGGVAVITGIVLGYTQLGFVAGNIILSVILAMGTLAFWAIQRTAGASHLMLEEQLTSSKVNVLSSNLGLKIGDVGIAFGAIRPEGRAIIHNKVVNVRSIGDFIADNARIVIVDITSSTVLIKQA